MKDLWGHLRALLRTVALPSEAGPLPLAAGAMLANEWLAPHLARLPARAPSAETRDEP